MTATPPISHDVNDCGSILNIKVPIPFCTDDILSAYRTRNLMAGRARVLGALQSLGRGLHRLEIFLTVSVIKIVRNRGVRNGGMEGVCVRVCARPLQPELSQRYYF